MVEHDLYIVIKKDGTPGVWYMDGRAISSVIELLDNFIGESRKLKDEVFIHTLGLSKSAMIMLNDLYRLGYNIAATKLKAEMRVRDIRYRITDTQAYYIQAKTGCKSYITLQCVESVIGLKGMPETVVDAEDAMQLYHYTRDNFLAGKKRSENRILYSSASISRTLFNRQNPDFSRASTRLKKILIGGREYTRGELVEQWARPGVKGALCYVSELGRTYRGPGIVVDANSLYDYVACAYPMPSPTLVACGSGTPKKRYLNRALYYMILKADVTMTLKPDGIPCISADGERGNEYLTGCRQRTLTLTPADRDILYDNYSISYFSIKSYMVWTDGSQEFKKYITPLYEKKRTLPKGIQRDYVKSCLTGFIGTFARRVQKMDYNITLDDTDGILYGHREPVQPEEYYKRLKKAEGLAYINMAIVTGAKHYILSYIKKHPDRFLYCDTDSIHLKGTEMPDDIPISDKMGDFKIEETFDDCIYHGQKNYIHKVGPRIIPTISGIPKDTYFTTLEEVYDHSFEIKLITEDITTEEVYYKKELRSFVPEKEKSPEEKREEKDLEWYDTNIVMPQMMKNNLTEARAELWNRMVDSGEIHPTFEKAIAFLKTGQSS